MSYEVLKKPLFVALDIDDLDKIREIVKETSDIVGGFKIGPRTLFKYGPAIVQEIAEQAPVFLDFKFYDIPSTMEAAVKSAFEMGATFCTIHASAGKKALLDLANLELELSSQRPFHILAVTILTSFDEKGLPSNYQKIDIPKHVELLVEESMENGIQNFVCSPHELKTLKKKFNDARFVTPGVRAEKGGDDQSRTATAQEALSWGASALVIGRPILQVKDPRSFILQL